MTLFEEPNSGIVSSDDIVLLQGQQHVLEIIATGAPLGDCLEALVKFVQSQEPGLRCGILMLDKEGLHFSHSFGTSLPDFYHAALIGLPIRPPYIGACGEAAHRCCPILVADVGESTLYEQSWRQLLNTAGIRAMRSTPITGIGGRVLGSFAFYFGTPRDPNPANPELVTVATHLAAIAIERERERRNLRAREAQLRAHAGQFAALIENAPFGTYVIDSSFRVVLASQIAKRAFAIPNMIGMDLGDALRTIWREPFCSEAIGRFRHTLESGEPHIQTDTVEERADRKAIEAYDWRIERILMSDGQFGVVCYFYDLSERKRLEAELRASNAVLEGVNRIFREALSARSEEELGRVCLAVAEDVTESAFSFMGEINFATNRLDDLSVSERGWKHFTMDDPQFPEGKAPMGFKIHGIYGRVLLDGESLIVNDPASHPDRVGTPKGHPPLKAFLGVPLKRGGKTIGMVGLGNREGGYRQKDLKAAEALASAILEALLRKRAEAALIESEERYRKLVDQTSDGIFLATAQGRYLDVNPAGCEMVGMTREEVLASTFTDVLHPDEHERLPAKMASFSDGKVQRDEWRFRRKGGTVFIGELAGRQLPDGRYLGVLRDITERKQAENRTKLLLREVNHRAKNMLSLVQAVARQTAAFSSADFLDRFSERIHALAASQDLLVKGEWRGVLLEDLVRSQLAHFKDWIGTRIELDGPPLLISASAAQVLGMAMHELATNAGKYGALSAGEGRVAIAWTVEPTGWDAKSFAITWRERGGPLTAPPSKSGFGSVVIGPLAESSLNAEVHLEFATAGLFWRLRCPEGGIVEGCQAAPAGKAAGSKQDGAAGLHPKILVVEDEALVAMEIAQVLQEAGFEVLGPARSVAAALALINENGCDAAVLDINLSGETSELVARRLLENGTRFVTLSGYSWEQHPSVFQGAPALAKPLRPLALIAELKRFLTNRNRAHAQV